MTKFTTSNVPLGTIAPSNNNGIWVKVTNGWKWDGPEGDGEVRAHLGDDWSGEFLVPPDKEEG